jgi:hypothetical protein
MEFGRFFRFDAALLITAADAGKQLSNYLEFCSTTPEGCGDCVTSPVPQKGEAPPRRGFANLQA